MIFSPLPPQGRSYPATGGGAVEMHPLVRHLLSLAPDRATALRVHDGPPLQEEASLQQAGAQILHSLVGVVPTEFAARGTRLETVFRPLLDEALALALRVRFPGAAAYPAGQAIVQAYVAAQQVVGAQRAAMALYCTR